MARTSYFQNDDLSFEELYKQSIESRPMLNNFGENVLQALRQEYPGKFEEARFDLAEPKDKFRAESKIKNDYERASQSGNKHANPRLAKRLAEEMKTWEGKDGNTLMKFYAKLDQEMEEKYRKRIVESSRI